MARVEFPLNQLVGAVNDVVESITKHREQTMQVLGEALLTRIKLAYIDKARGGTGDDGISWKPITVQTILGRLRRAGHIKVKRDKNQKLPASQERFRRATYTVTSKSKNNAELFKQLADAGVGFTDKKGSKVGSTSRHASGTVLKVSSKVRKQQVTFSPGSYEIGVDTGLQRNSAGPGYMAPDGDGGNIFTKDEQSFVVGFGRSYSSYFDRHRKLIPEVLPSSWQEELEDLARERKAKIIEDVFRERGLN